MNKSTNARKPSPGRDGSDDRQQTEPQNGRVYYADFGQKLDDQTQQKLRAQAEQEQRELEAGEIREENAHILRLMRGETDLVQFRETTKGIARYFPIRSALAKAVVRIQGVGLLTSAALNVEEDFVLASVMKAMSTVDKLDYMVSRREQERGINPAIGDLLADGVEDAIESAKHRRAKLRGSIDRLTDI